MRRGVQDRKPKEAQQKVERHPDTAERDFRSLLGVEHEPYTMPVWVIP